MTSFAVQMALDVKRAAANHIGVLYRLQRLMERSYPDLEFFNDDVIDTLYPGHPTKSDRKKREEISKQAIETLANKWSKLEPQEVIQHLQRIELGLSQEQPRLTPDLCYRLAEKTTKPLLWFDLMLPTTLPADTIMPFLQEVIRHAIAGWEQALRSSFETERATRQCLSDYSDSPACT